MPLKKLTATLVIILVCSCTMLAQTREQYLHNSKRQKTWGFIVAATVPIFTVAAFASDDDYTPTSYYDPSPRISDRTSLFITAGTAAAAATVLFIASAKNKKKGMSASLRSRQLNYVLSNAAKRSLTTELTFRIPIH